MHLSFSLQGDYRERRVQIMRETEHQVVCVCVVLEARVENECSNPPEHLCE